MTAYIQSIAQRGKKASTQLRIQPSVVKNKILHTIANLLITQQTQILQANSLDLAYAKQQGLSPALIDRLVLDEKIIANISSDVTKLIALDDPIGQILDGKTLDNGLDIVRKIVPLGVLGVIYESRPNVTIDIAALALKTGNCAILRGGKECINTNKVLVKIIQQALIEQNLSPDCIILVEDTDRKYIADIIQQDKYIDMIIPRGGQALQDFCKQNSTIPVIIGGIGVCHIFVEQSADLDKSMRLIDNAKNQRPSTCNSLETLLIERAIIDDFLAKFRQYFANSAMKIHVCAELAPKMDKIGLKYELTNPQKLSQEFLSHDLNMVIVDDFASAISHIETYGSAHSEAILTENMKLAHDFINYVDAAAVYVNASTRFTDGAQFGLGAEVAVSTQKLHARGPMGLHSLTTYKWIAKGNYLVRS